MGKTRRPIAPDKRARPCDLERLAKEGVEFKRAVDDGGAFIKKGEIAFGIDRAKEYFDIDGYQVFKGNLKKAGLAVVDIDHPDLPLGLDLLKVFQKSGTYGTKSRTIGYHFFVRVDDWLDDIQGEPEIKDENGKVIAELKRSWITLYRPPFEKEMPILDASDERLALWREKLRAAADARPKRTRVEITEIHEAVMEWEKRVRALPEGGKNIGFTQILGEVKSALWPKQNDLALQIAINLQRIYDKEVSPDDSSFEVERLRDYWFAPPEQKEEGEAQPFSGGHVPSSDRDHSQEEVNYWEERGKEEKKKKTKEKKPKVDWLSVVFDKYLKDNYGGEEGLCLVVAEAGKTHVKEVVCWDKRKARYMSAKFANLRGSMVNDIHNQYLLTLAEKEGKLPSMTTYGKTRNVIANELLNRCGVTEEYLSEFDRPSNRRFLFGEYGVCSVRVSNPEAAPKDYRYELHTGGVNKAEYKLRRDIEGHIATDKEYEDDLPGMLEEFSAYFSKFETDHETSFNGNFLLDGLQLHIASAFVDVQLRPLGICWGDGNNGKSNFWRYICMALGDQVADNGLHEATFTDGTGSVTTGPRLAGHRQKLVGKALCIVPESPRKPVLDTGFIKRFTAKDEPVPVGGMYKDDIDVILECVAMMSLNNVPTIYDQKLGMHRRIYLYPFLEEFTKMLSQDEMDGKFLKYLPTIRRWIFEGIRRLVEVYHCVLPEQHITIKEIRKEFDEITQSDIKAELSKSFRKVMPTKKKDKVDYYYQSRRARQGFIGGVTTEEKGQSVDAYDPWFGMMLAVRILIKAANIRQDKYSNNKIKEILQELGFQFNGSMITNIIHTDYFLERVADTYGAERIPAMLRSMYRHYKSGSFCQPYELATDSYLPEGYNPQLPNLEVENLGDFGDEDDL